MRTQNNTRGKKSDRIKTPALRLTERDFQILLHTMKNEFCSSEDIRLKFWKNDKGAKTYNRRLRKLVQAGYLRQILGPEFRNKAYKVTDKGYRTLEGRFGKIGRNFSTRMFKTSIKHDSLVNKIGVILSESPRVSGFTVAHDLLDELGLTGEMRSSGRRFEVNIPDALFDLQGRDRVLRAALEVELTQKNTGRYKRILANHLTSLEWDVTFYILESDTLQSKLIEIISDLKVNSLEVRCAEKRNGIYFGLLSDLESRGIEAEFSDGSVKVSMGARMKK